MAAEGFIFGLGYQPGKPWERYLSELEDHRPGRNLPAGHVPGTFLVADVAGEIVAGRPSGSRSTRFSPSGAATSAMASCRSIGAGGTPPRSCGRA
jgi:hypothetical protein